MADANDTLSVVHDLIETCRDGQTGYVHAAGIIKDQRLKQFFESQALERGRFLSELKEAAKSLGETDPDTSGSTAAVLHRMWFETKSDMGLGDESIVSSVEQGEDSAKETYEKALHSGLPDALRQLVNAQAQSVFAAHDRVRSIRDRAA